MVIMSSQIEDNEGEQPKRLITFGTMFGFVSAVVLVDTLLLTFAFLILWALAGYFRLSLVPFTILNALILIPTAWACARVGILAFEAETDPANN
ncbi:hypothetical protein B0E33_20620 [Roseibium algicola]|uniref:Uncharacterized protein n=2 Tax=Roseibium algicola TaxID=2857014 RepID=A0ABM6I5G3_9HYPH|nr:hypothetical protein B0E33_20620 [Roseibium aggregatum]